MFRSFLMAIVMLVAVVAFTATPAQAQYYGGGYHHGWGGGGWHHWGWHPWHRWGGWHHHW